MDTDFELVGLFVWRVQVPVYVDGVGEWLGEAVGLPLQVRVQEPGEAVTVTHEENVGVGAAGDRVQLGGDPVLVGLGDWVVLGVPVGTQVGVRVAVGVGDRGVKERTRVRVSECVRVSDTVSAHDAVSDTVRLWEAVPRRDLVDGEGV